MTEAGAQQFGEYGLETLARMRATLALRDRERLDAALRSVRLAARERAQAAREEGRTDPDELRAEVGQLARILQEAVRGVTTAEEVVEALERVARHWRKADRVTAKIASEDGSFDPSIVRSDESDSG